MNTVTFKIEGMHCGGCAATIEALLARNDGVKKAAASFESGEARVFYDAGAISERELAAVIEKAGYRVTGSRAS